VRSATHYSIGEGEASAYARDGAVCLRGAIAPVWLDLIARAFERARARPSPWASDHMPERPGRFVTDLAMAQHDDELRRFVFDSPAAAIAAWLMRSSTLTFFFDTMWIKDSGVSKRTNWHQDQPYYTVDGDQMCVLWLPLDPVPEDSALEFVRGSHRWGTWFEPMRTTDGGAFYAGSPYAPVPDVDGERARYDILSWAMEPGDCVVFHGLTLHGGAADPRGRSARRAYSTVWLGDDARFAARPGAARPRFEGHGLSPGDPMTCAMFPCVWPRAHGGSA